MPRGQNLGKDRLPKQARLKLLGIHETLSPGECSLLVRVRMSKALAARFEAMSPKDRGRVIAAGLEALEVEHAKTHE